MSAWSEGISGRRFAGWMLAAGVAACLASPAGAQTVSATCDNAGLLADQQSFENGGAKSDQAVHVCGKVVSVAPNSKRTRSGVHGYFYMSVGNGVSIRIVSDLDRMNAPTWPFVAKGDTVEVVGRYYYDSPRQQGIDWTHHGTGRTWPVEGYVTVNGTKYQ